jgi:hypothetical protein
MRLVLADNNVTPLANAVVPSGGVETPLDTPSGQQSGLKMNVNITVEAGQVADFVIDFDACKSVVKRGNSGQYNLKPVLTVTPRLSGTIVGYVDMSLATTATNVSAQNSAGAVIKATPPDVTTGQFTLFPVPQGTYNLVVTAPGYATGVITGVPVVATTNIGSNTVRIALPALTTTPTTRNATGIVSIVGDPIDTNATVRVLQVLSGGPTVEVAAMPADGLTGAYAFALPIASPVKTAYEASPASITFAANSADVNLTAAGKYTLEASILASATPMTADINLLSANVDTPFAF